MHSITAVRRLHGLDTLRAAAIILVVLYHTTINVTFKPSFGPFGTLGWAGVDLFFVLSGYLIGNQIFAAFARGERFSLARFYARRALRTLPNFYVVLTLYFCLPLVLGGTPPPSLWRFVSFTQNVGLHPGTAFSHAWSLCIEEQFYVMLPIIALLVGWSRSIRLGWVILIGAMAAAAMLRYWLWRQYGGDGAAYYQHIYYASWCRFDELLPGVALALIKNFHAATWQRLIAAGNRTLCAGLASTLLTLFLFLNFHAQEPDGYRLWMSVVGYPMLACSFALLTLAALSPNSWLARCRIPGAGSLALWSYAIYLTHKAVMHVLKTNFIAHGYDASAPLSLAVMLGSSVIVGWLLYTLVETPFMNLRERWFGTHQSAPLTRDRIQVAAQISDGTPTLYPCTPSMPSTVSIAQSSSDSTDSAIT